jgi:predicted PurR-regulated permease PerM
VSAGQVAALIAAGAFVVLVGLLAVPLIKLGRTLDAATQAIRKASAEADPLLNGANTTVTHVNAQLERLDGITANAAAVTGNVSALTSLFTATLGGPLVRVAALSYGVSKAMSRRKRKDAGRGRRPHGRRRNGDTR